MLIVRTYHCDGCGTEFEFLQDREDGPPPCGVCYSDTTLGVGKLNIGLSDASRVTDYAQEMVSKSYGLTNLKTNLREGDVAAPSPQMKTAEGKAMLKAIEGGQVWQPPTDVASALELGKTIPKNQKWGGKFEMTDFHKQLRANPVRMDNPSNRRPSPPKK